MRRHRSSAVGADGSPAVVDTRLEGGIYDDGRVILRVPDAEVARRVAGEVQDLDPPVPPQPQGLSAAQAHVDRGVSAQLRTDPILGFLVGTEAVWLGPKVDLRRYPFVALYPCPVGLATREPKPRAHLLKGAVAAAVVDVGVAYDDLVHVFDAEAYPLQVRDDDIPGRAGEAGVDEDRPLLPEEQVLAHESLPEVRLDAVDALQYLHLRPYTNHPGNPAQRNPGRGSLYPSSKEARIPCTSPATGQ